MVSSWVSEKLGKHVFERPLGVPRSHCLAAFYLLPLAATWGRGFSHARGAWGFISTHQIGLPTNTGLALGMVNSRQFVSLFPGKRRKYCSAPTGSPSQGVPL